LRILNTTSATPARTPSYLRLLLVVLGTATFFEGFDTAISAIVLKDLAESFNIPLDETAQITGPLIPIGLGAFGALAVTMLGDRIGRRPLLVGTTFMYAIFTGLTATSQNLTQFVIFQFFARSFLLAEYATAITIVSEEFPAERRGRALGTLTALGALGLPIVAVLHLLVKDTALGWRILYLVGLIPLVAIGFLRLKLKETERWTAAKADGSTMSGHRIRQVLRVGHRRTMWMVGALYFFSHFALLGAVAWWPFYAGVTLGYSDETIAVLLGIAYPLGVTGYYLAGRLADRFGRRRTGTVFLFVGMVFGILVFQISDPTLMFPALVLAVFFGFGMNPILAAMAAELFPTALRATAVAFVRSIFGTIGGIAGPITVGVLAGASAAERFPSMPLLGNMGDVVGVVALMNIPAAIMLWQLPETAGSELESITAEDQEALTPEIS
jgi:putative MFS transporter